ncbi:MAG: TIGR00730 family Rossman fold protein [Acutalibacteraceae bacterium]|nr:TIGR00730 family Rossman fold protein [Acutalibacteraceae bacterium]
MNICLYGASSSAIAKSYINPTEELGAKIAERGHTLIYGGGAEGLMGAAARGAYSQGGKIIGIVPSFLNVDGILFDNCDEMIFTETMRERKQLLEEKSDAFIVTPGGVGTFDEFFEILTLKQLGRHSKPIAVFNINGYFDSLIEQLKNAVRKQFMNPESFELCFFTDNADKLINYLEYAVSEPEQAKIYKDLK